MSFYRLKRHVLLPKDFQRIREVNSISFISIHEGPGGQKKKKKSRAKITHAAITRGDITDQTMSYDKHRIVTFYIPDPRSKGAREKLDYAVSDTSILFPAKSRYAPPPKKVTVHSTSTTKYRYYYYYSSGVLYMRYDPHDPAAFFIITFFTINIYFSCDVDPPPTFALLSCWKILSWK